MRFHLPFKHVYGYCHCQVTVFLHISMKVLTLPYFLWSCIIGHCAHKFMGFLLTFLCNVYKLTQDTQDTWKELFSFRMTCDPQHEVEKDWETIRHECMSKSFSVGNNQQPARKIWPFSRILGPIKMPISESAFIIQGAEMLLFHYGPHVPMRQCPHRAWMLDKPHGRPCE